MVTMYSGDSKATRWVCSLANILRMLFWERNHNTTFKGQRHVKAASVFSEREYSKPCCCYLIAVFNNGTHDGSVLQWSWKNNCSIPGKKSEPMQIKWSRLNHNYRLKIEWGQRFTPTISFMIIFSLAVNFCSEFAMGTGHYRMNFKMWVANK